MIFIFISKAETNNVPYVGLPFLFDIYVHDGSNHGLHGFLFWWLMFSIVPNWRYSNVCDVCPSVSITSDSSDAEKWALRSRNPGLWLDPDRRERGWNLYFENLKFIKIIEWFNAIKKNNYLFISIFSFAF